MCLEELNILPDIRIDWVDILYNDVGLNDLDQLWLVGLFKIRNCY